jgi:hypothetical protein
MSLVRVVVWTGLGLVGLVVVAVGGGFGVWELRRQQVLDESGRLLEQLAASAPSERPAYLPPGAPEGTADERAKRARAALDQCVGADPARRADPAAKGCEAEIDAWLRAPRTPQISGFEPWKARGRATAASPLDRAEARLHAHLDAGRAGDALRTCLDLIAWARETERPGLSVSLILVGTAGGPALIDDCVLAVAGAEDAALVAASASVAALRAGFDPVVGTRELTVRDAKRVARRGHALRYAFDDPWESFEALSRLRSTLAKAGTRSAAPPMSLGPVAAPAAQIFAAAIAVQQAARRTGVWPPPDAAWREAPALAGSALADVQVRPEAGGVRLVTDSLSALLPRRAPLDAAPRLRAAWAAAGRASGATQQRAHGLAAGLAANAAVARWLKEPTTHPPRGPGEPLNAWLLGTDGDVRAWRTVTDPPSEWRLGSGSKGAPEPAEGHTRGRAEVIDRAGRVRGAVVVDLAFVPMAVGGVTISGPAPGPADDAVNRVLDTPNGLVLRWTEAPLGTSNALTLSLPLEPGPLP